MKSEMTVRNLRTAEWLLQLPAHREFLSFALFTVTTPTTVLAAVSWCPSHVREQVPQAWDRAWIWRVTSEDAARLARGRLLVAPLREAAGRPPDLLREKHSPYHIRPELTVWCGSTRRRVRRRHVKREVSNASGRTHELKESAKPEPGAGWAGQENK